jgi:broad specificity phosphatase PhoE
MKSTRLLLIRHGESEANRERRFAGHSDFPLSEKGRLQAECTADYIASNYAVDAVYASDLKRAYDTALATARRFSLPVIPCEDLREIFAGEWEGLFFDEIRVRYEGDFEIWKTDVGRAQCTGGEKVSELQSRVFAALCRIAEQNPQKTVAIGTHATPIRATECILRGKPLSEMHTVPWVTNASVTELLYEDGKFSLVSAGENSHLAKLQTSLPGNV